MEKKRIAVLGTGTIGLMLGSLLTKHGHDVTIVSMFRKSMAELLSQEGVTLQIGNDVCSIPVQAAHVDELSDRNLFDLVFVTGRSNDTEDIVRRFVPYMTGDTWVISLQNGLNDECIAGIVGWERVVPCVCFAGGQCPKPNYVVTHDGYFILGEIGGAITPRIKELERILSCAKRVELSGNILAERWRKMAEVCLTVPTATITGYSLFSHYDEPEIPRFFGKLAVEIWAAREAAGIPSYPILGLNGQEWAVLAQGEDAVLREKFLNASRRPKRKIVQTDMSLPSLEPVDAYTADIRRGRELEIDFMNGYIIRKGELLGISMECNRKLVAMVYEIKMGLRTACPENLKEI